MMSTEPPMEPKKEKEKVRKEINLLMLIIWIVRHANPSYVNSDANELVTRHLEDLEKSLKEKLTSYAGYLIDDEQAFEIAVAFYKSFMVGRVCFLTESYFHNAERINKSRDDDPVTIKERESNRRTIEHIKANLNKREAFIIFLKSTEARNRGKWLNENLSLLIEAIKHITKHPIYHKLGITLKVEQKTIHAILTEICLTWEAFRKSAEHATTTLFAEPEENGATKLIERQARLSRELFGEELARAQREVQSLVQRLWNSMPWEDICDESQEQVIDTLSNLMKKITSQSSQQAQHEHLIQHSLIGGSKIAKKDVEEAIKENEQYCSEITEHKKINSNPKIKSRSGRVDRKKQIPDHENQAYRSKRGQGDDDYRDAQHLPNSPSRLRRDPAERAFAREDDAEYCKKIIKIVYEEKERLRNLPERDRVKYFLETVFTGYLEKRTKDWRRCIRCLHHAWYTREIWRKCKAQVRREEDMSRLLEVIRVRMKSRKSDDLFKNFESMKIELLKILESTKIDDRLCKETGIDDKKRLNVAKRAAIEKVQRTPIDEPANEQPDDETQSDPDSPNIQ